MSGKDSTIRGIRLHVLSPLPMTTNHRPLRKQPPVPVARQEQQRRRHPCLATSFVAGTDTAREDKIVVPSLALQRGPPAVPITIEIDSISDT
mmetsp:Transcript_4651/g.9603  ORF Transcript_4651/g.9603 Transcript_4651/m.9603 type:complete len:92 (-) Transcript_4651:1686-1961(-)